MRPQSPDTDPKIEKIQIEAYRRMPAWQKMRIVCDLNEAAQTVAMADIRRRHPAAARTAVTSATLGMFTPSRRSITREAFFLLILFLLKKMKYLGFAVVWPFEVYQRISSGCKHCKKTSL